MFLGSFCRANIALPSKFKVHNSPKNQIFLEDIDLWSCCVKVLALARSPLLTSRFTSMSGAVTLGCKSSYMFNCSWVFLGINLQSEDIKPAGSSGNCCPWCRLFHRQASPLTWWNWTTDQIVNDTNQNKGIKLNNQLLHKCWIYCCWSPKDTKVENYSRVRKNERCQKTSDARWSLHKSSLGYLCTSVDHSVGWSCHFTKTSG